MSENVVVERIAKERNALYEKDHPQHPHISYEELDEDVQQHFRQDALRILRIVDEYMSTLTILKPSGFYIERFKRIEYKTPSPLLEDAFRIAREAGNETHKDRKARMD